MLTPRPRTSVLAALLFLLPIGGSATAQPAIVEAAAPLPAAAAEPPPELLSRERLGPRLLQLRFATEAMRDIRPGNPYADGTTGVRVLLPPGYDRQPGRRWPVLYLLHGCCDSAFSGRPESLGYRSWTERGQAEQLTEDAPFIVVMPDGLNAGWYADQYGAAGEGGPRVETYQLRQLVPWVDAHLRTDARRAARAVAGLSMGGYGAMSYAARHPDLFSFAASWSGAVDNGHDSYVYPVPSPTTSDGVTVLDLRAPSGTWGVRALHEVRARMHNPVDLAENLRGLALVLRTGDGRKPDGSTDSVEAGVHDESATLHRRLLEMQIPHEWDDYGAGEHTWPHFSRGLAQLVGPLTRHFDRGVKAPAAFSYLVGEERSDVHGYRLAADRPHLELARWELSPMRIAVRGSGDQLVTTPRLYRPFGRYRITATRNGQRQVLQTTADGTGRLSLRLRTDRVSSGQQFRTGTTTRLNTVDVLVEHAS